MYRLNKQIQHFHSTGAPKLSPGYSPDVGSSVGLVMANIKNELENEIIKPLMNNGTIKLYCQLVDDTLLVVSPQDVNRVHNLLNSFENNLRFIVNFLKNEVPHICGLEFSHEDIFVYWKDTNTGLYVN